MTLDRRLDPPRITLLEQLLAEEGYAQICQKAGDWCALMPQMFTVGLFVGLDATGYKRRYCYERYADALKALRDWDGIDDPPGLWVKEKPSDRLGPGAIDG